MSALLAEAPFIAIAAAIHSTQSRSLPLDQTLSMIPSSRLPDAVIMVQEEFVKVCKVGVALFARVARVEVLQGGRHDIQ